MFASARLRRYNADMDASASGFVRLGGSDGGKK